MAYVAKIGDKWAMVVDGQAGSLCQALGPPVFSPDGKRLAYIMGKGQKQLVAVDGQLGPEYDGIKGYLLFFPSYYSRPD